MKREDAERLGIVTATQEGAEEMLRDLEMLRGKYEMIGSYPDLVAQAQMWDGKTEVDPVGLYLERVQAEREQARAEGELDADAYLAEQARKAAAEAVPTLSFSMTPEMESIKVEAVAAGTFMKAPNGKATNLTELQWLQVRTKAFKEWFGDWERTADLTFKVKSITQKEADAELQKLAHVPLLNDGRYGVPAEVNREQREKLLSNTARRKSEANGFSKDEHFFLASKIQKLYKHAVCLGDYRDVNGARDVLAIRRFAAPFVVNGKRGYALLTVKITERNYRQRGGVIVSNNEARAYSIELDELRGIDSQLQRLEPLRMEKMVGFKKQFEPRGTVENVDIQDSPSPSSGEILEVFNAKVKEYFENVSKVVDENGEPLVVTHATNSEPFTVFKRGERAGLSGKGIYFSPDGVSIWGRNVMRCFLNVRNPLTKENAPREVNNGGMSAVIPDVFEKYPEFDGVMIRRDEITVRDPEQIKSATDNKGTFDWSNPDITFSMGAERNLAAVHSLSPEKFLAALELGGMPMPSVAVTRLDKPYSWGGADAINLVGRPEMVDPRKKSKVYMHDAYTGKMPPVMYRKKNDAAAAKAFSVQQVHGSRTGRLEFQAEREKKNPASD